MFLKTRRERVHVVDVLARPHPLLQGRLVRKFGHFGQGQCRRVYLVLVHHPMMRVVHEPGIVARVIKPDRQADGGDEHAPRVGRGAGLGHVHRRRVRVCRWDDERRCRLRPRPRMTVVGVAEEHLHLRAVVLEIEEVRELGEEVCEDVSVGRGIPYVCGRSWEGVVVIGRRRDRGWRGREHGHGHGDRSGIGRSEADGLLVDCSLGGWEIDGARKHEGWSG